MFFWPASFVLPQSLRACGDTRYVMMVSVISMWFFRLAAGVILATVCGFGVVGIWIAMFIDWFFRITCFIIRYCHGKWQSKVLN